jgi:hypothetical protein
MDKTQFKSLIHQCIKEILNENSNNVNEEFSGGSQILHNPDLQECNCKGTCNCAKPMEAKKWIQKAVHPSRKGMFSGENIADLKAKLSKIKAQTAKYKERGESVPSELRKKIAQLVFAIRAKGKKGLAESINEEASMAAGELDAIAHYVEHLKQFVTDDSNLEDWQKAKITLAHHYLESVFSNLNHNQGGSTETPGTGAATELPMPVGDEQGESEESDEEETQMERMHEAGCKCKQCGSKKVKECHCGVCAVCKGMK